MAIPGDKFSSKISSVWNFKYDILHIKPHNLIFIIGNTVTEVIFVTSLCVFPSYLKKKI